MKEHRAIRNNPRQADTRIARCEWQGCHETGEYRAPKSRDELNSYRWFCLAHIREYNKSWNYYEGMNDRQVEEDLRHDTVWNRPTWQLGSNAGAFGPGNRTDPFSLFGDNGNDHRTNSSGNSTNTRPPVSKEEEHAYHTLGLRYPVTLEDIKVRYKELVKEHHPDANRGTPESEERLKEINQAYYVLRDTISAVS